MLASVLQKQHENRAEAAAELAALQAELRAAQDEEAALRASTTGEPARLAAEESRLAQQLQQQIRAAAVRAVGQFAATTAAAQDRVSKQRYAQQLAAQHRANEEVDGHLAYLHRHSMRVSEELAEQATTAYLNVHRKERSHWLGARQAAKNQLQTAQLDFAALVHDVGTLIQHEDNASLVVEKGSYAEQDDDIANMDDVNSEDESLHEGGGSQDGGGSMRTRATKRTTATRKTGVTAVSRALQSVAGRSRSSRRMQAAATLFGGSRRDGAGMRTVRTSSRESMIVDGVGEIRGGRGPNLLSKPRPGGGDDDGIRGGISDEESTDSEDEGVDFRGTTHDKLTSEPFLLHKDRVNAFYEDAQRFLGPDPKSAHYTGEAEQELKHRVLAALRRDITRADLRTHTLPSARVGTVTAFLDMSVPTVHHETLELTDGSFSSPLGHVLSKAAGETPHSPRRASMAIARRRSTLGPLTPLANSGRASSAPKERTRAPPSPPPRFPRDGAGEGGSDPMQRPTGLSVRTGGSPLQRGVPPPSTEPTAGSVGSSSPRRRVTISRTASESRIVIPDAPVFKGGGNVPSPSARAGSPRKSILKRSSSGRIVDSPGDGSPKRAGFAVGGAGGQRARARTAPSLGFSIAEEEQHDSAVPLQRDVSLESAVSNDSAFDVGGPVRSVSVSSPGLAGLLAPVAELPPSMETVTPHSYGNSTRPPAAMHFGGQGEAVSLGSSARSLSDTLHRSATMGQHFPPQAPAARDSAVTAVPAPRCDALGCTAAATRGSTSRSGGGLALTAGGVDGSECFAPEDGDGQLNDTAGELVFSTERQDAADVVRSVGPVALPDEEALMPDDLEVALDAQETQRGRTAMDKLRVSELLCCMVHCLLAVRVCCAQDAVLRDYKRGVTYSPRELLQWLQSTQKMAVETSLIRGDADTLRSIKVSAKHRTQGRLHACMLHHAPPPLLQEAYEAELRRLGEIASIVAMEDYYAHLTAASEEARFAVDAHGEEASDAVHARLAADGDALGAAMERQGELMSTAAQVRADIALSHKAYEAKHGETVPVARELLPHIDQLPQELLLGT